MFQHDRLNSEITLLQKIKNLDYILLISVILLSIISVFVMYSTDGGEILFHTKNHFLKLTVFFPLMIFVAFFNIKFFPFIFFDLSSFSYFSPTFDYIFGNYKINDSGRILIDDPASTKMFCFPPNENVEMNTDIILDFLTSNDLDLKSADGTPENIFFESENKKLYLKLID